MKTTSAAATTPELYTPSAQQPAKLLTARTIKIDSCIMGSDGSYLLDLNGGDDCEFYATVESSVYDPYGYPSVDYVRPVSVVGWWGKDTPSLEQVSAWIAANRTIVDSAIVDAFIDAKAG